MTYKHAELGAQNILEKDKEHNKILKNDGQGEPSYEDRAITRLVLKRLFINEQIKKL